jgi:hypothetical protein
MLLSNHLFHLRALPSHLFLLDPSPARTPRSRFQSLLCSRAVRTRADLQRARVRVSKLRRILKLAAEMRQLSVADNQNSTVAGFVR